MKVKKTEFQLDDYVKGRRIGGPTSFNFKREYLTALPYIEDGTIDLYHSGLNSEKYGQWKLVLRLQKKSKSFYIRNRKGMRGKLGSWPSDPDLDNLPPGMFTSLTKVEEAFAERVKELNQHIDGVAKYKEMTIREYAADQYITDRKKTGVKSGKIRPLSDKTLLGLITGFPNWIDQKIKAANKDWPDEFQAYWDDIEYRCKTTGQLKTGITTDTQRKYYSAMNALFNMCVKKGYINHNPIDGRANLFPRNEGKKKIRYKYEYEEAIDFIFDEAVGNQGGKLIIATMILTGARNAEVYKNYKTNFDVAERSIHIPAHISKNKQSRPVYAENERYWKEVQHYNKVFWEENKQGFMFPSFKSASGHATAGVYRPIWGQIKDRFNLPKEGRLYDNRHTFCSKLVKAAGIAVASEIIGDSPETTLKYYNENEVEDARKAIWEMHNGSKAQASAPEPAPTLIPTTAATETRTVVHLGKLPDEITEFFEVFAGGREFPGDGLIYQEDWLSLISKVQKKVERGRMGEEAEEWLEAVT